MPRTRYPLPSIAELSRMIYDAWTDDHAAAQHGDEWPEGKDVRLHTFGSDRSLYGYRDCWFVNYGSSDYDHAHGCAIGASGYDPSERPTKKAAQAIARDLIEQCRDGIAELRTA